MKDLQDRLEEIEKKLLDGAEILDKAVKEMNIKEDEKDFIKFLDARLSYQKFINLFVQYEIDVIKGKRKTR